MLHPTIQPSYSSKPRRISRLSSPSVNITTTFESPFKQDSTLLWSNYPRTWLAYKRGIVLQAGEAPKLCTTRTKVPRGTRVNNTNTRTQIHKHKASTVRSQQRLSRSATNNRALLMLCNTKNSLAANTSSSTP